MPGKPQPNLTNPTQASDQPADGPNAQSTASAAPAAGNAGACANAYYPSTPGAIWTYANTSPMAPNSVSTRTISNISPTGFATNNAFSDAQVSIKWSCKDGNLTMLNTATLTTKDISAKVASVSSTGYFIPAAITDGSTWAETLNILTTGTVGKTEVTQKNDTKIDCTANGKESVQVQAGKFDALKVTCVYDITTITDIAGQSKPGKPVNTPITFTYWYAAGVGLVKSDETGSIIGTSELTSYSIP
jgi:hypothetical protein